MPILTLSGRAEAPVEDVWKLLHDPARFPEWWAGIETVRTTDKAEFTMWPTGYPDFPMAQRLTSDRADGRVTVSCLVSDLEFLWQLGEDGDCTTIEVRVDLPDKQAHRLDTQRAVITESIARLCQLAAATAHHVPPSP
jgi:uncharacterized protein YndB with AHSA1/START domain